MNIQNTPNIQMKYLLWIDIETTGLDINNDKILEVALIITE